MAGNANAKRKQEGVPIEMTEEIFKYLPGKSLLRFTTLSKPINSLINTRRFIKRHLSMSVSTNNDLSLIIFDDESNKFIVSLDYYQYDTSLQNILKHPLENKKTSWIQPVSVFSDIIGSSHGLICIDNWHFRDDINILNPTTRKHRVLPPYGTQLPDLVNSFHGFGYDPYNDDYVVVVLIQSDEVTYFEAGIYNFNKNDWRIAKEDSFPFFLSYDESNATFVSGWLHWQANEKTPHRYASGERDETTTIVVAFDLDMKNWRIIPLPDVVESTPARMHLSTLGECLSIIVEVPQNLHVWVMKEYGVKKSWEKLFSFSDEELVQGCTKVSCLGYSENKDEVLMHVIGYLGHRCFWYDLKKKETRAVEHLPIRLGATVVDVSHFTHTVVVGSLVSP